MMCRVCFTVFFLALFFDVSCSKKKSKFRFANIYGDHMVLQQAPLRARVWGYGEVGQAVEISYAYTKLKCNVIKGPNNMGIWSITLTPLKTGAPIDITATSNVNGIKETIKLKSVLFGDVWICAGQSNMEYDFIESDHELSATKQLKHLERIRIFAAKKSVSDAPLDELEGIKQRWSVPTRKNIRKFSAVCWYYGMKLYKELDYPIGLVELAWGGTFIESWSPPEALNECGIKRILPEETKEMLSRSDVSKTLSLSCLWNAMMHPFLKMSIYGMVWYQGESNAVMSPNSYECMFQAVIKYWRKKWYNATEHNTLEIFPFGFVQLSTVDPKDAHLPNANFAPLRWFQTAQYGYVPNDRQQNVFMAVAMDLGNSFSPYTEIHPTDKKDVGARLALAALSVAYGEDVYYSGPIVLKVQQLKRPHHVEVKVVFKSVLKKIEVRDTSGFEVRCQFGTKWIKATIIRSGLRSVVITPSNDCSIEAVRYAWSDHPCKFKKCAIYSGNLPSPPFIKCLKPFDQCSSAVL